MKKILTMLFVVFALFTLIACQTAASLQTVINSVEIEFSGEDSLASVTTHLTLPNSSDKNKDAVFTWETDKPSVIDSFGTVNRPEVTTDVKLTVTVSLNGTTESRDFYLTVIGLYNDVIVEFVVLDQVYKTYTIKAGQYIMGFANPQVEGYAFEGWFISPELTTQYQFTQPIQSSMTIVARMTEIPMGSYTLEIYEQNILDDNYTLFSTANLEAPVGSNYNLPITRTGFTLNTELSTTQTTVTETAQTLKLYFDRNTYTITFMSEGVEIGTEDIKYGQTIEFPDDLVKENHVLEGWATNSAGTILFDEETIVTADTTLYAVWSYDAVYTDYYASLSGVTDAQLKAALRTLISDMNLRTYGEARYTLDDSDRDPNNANNVILVYNRASISGVWNGSSWTREHVWPQSKLGASADNGTANIASDMQNLKPINQPINEVRSDKPFSDGSGTHGVVADGGYYPGDADRGDIARIIFYMHVRWNLTISRSTVGDINLFLKWHSEDPVDDFERNRNEVLFNAQANRNPFIDHPEFAERIWGPIVVTSSYQNTQLRIEHQVPKLYTFVTVDINYTELKKTQYIM